jgi:UrcA family protein
MSTLKFDARAPAHPVCQHFHTEQEIDMYTIIKYLVAGVAALLMLAGEGALFAADSFPDATPSSVTVRYADLNLDRPADVAKLYHRIATASHSVCGQRELPGSLQPSTAWAQCVRDAIAQAVARVDRPELSAYHERQVGRAPQRDARIAQG